MEKIEPVEFAIIRDTLVIFGKGEEYTATSLIDFFKESDNCFVVCRKGTIDQEDAYVTYRLKYCNRVVELNTEYLWKNGIKNVNSIILLASDNKERFLIVTEENILNRAYRFKESTTSSDTSILPMLEELKVKEKVKINTNKFGKIN